MKEARDQKAMRLLKQLKGKGLSVGQIADLLGNEIDKRTLYRWLSGDAKPQRTSDVEKIQNLVNRL